MDVMPVRCLLTVVKLFETDISVVLGTWPALFYNHCNAAAILLFVVSQRDGQADATLEDHCPDMSISSHPAYSIC